jgi:hypothetical protein
MNFRFILLNSLILLSLIALMQLTFPIFSERELPHWGFHFLFVFLFISTLSSAYIIEKSMRSKPQAFVNVFMAMSSIRMLLSILVVVILILKAGENAKYLAVYFVVGYMFFLVAEVMYLFRRSKKVSK